MLPLNFPLPDGYGVEILRTEVGSTLYGTGLPGGEDHDEMGVFVPAPQFVIGLDGLDHYKYRTQPEGSRSGPGDTDLIVYSLRKWASLALKGNPSVLLPLFAPEDKLVICSDLGQELRENPVWFWSQRAQGAFLGYLNQQRDRLLGARGAAGRVRKTADGGRDWKYAMHMLRLGYQGVEFMETGRMALPMVEETRQFLVEVRKGNVEFDQVMATATDLIQALEGEFHAPKKPNTEAVDHFVQRAFVRTWKDSLESLA